MACEHTGLVVTANARPDLEPRLIQVTLTCYACDKTETDFKQDGETVPECAQRALKKVFYDPPKVPQE